MDKVFQSENINELAAALSKAQSVLEPASKSADNPFFKSKYADLPECIDAAKEALASNGLSVAQFTDVTEGKVTLITQLIHSSGQWIRGYYPVNPVKTDPQSLGAAMTYARRYAFCAITGVSAVDEDDDGNAASGNVEAKPIKTKGLAAIKKEIENADDPAVVWGANKPEIDQMQKASPANYQTLLDAAKRRKEALSSMKKMVEDVKEQTNG